MDYANEGTRGTGDGNYIKFKKTFAEIVRCCYDDVTGGGIHDKTPVGEMGDPSMLINDLEEEFSIKMNDYDGTGTFGELMEYAFGKMREKELSDHPDDDFYSD